jgi:hypothetical protein
MESLKPRLLYGLREAEWPDSFKKEVDAVLRWKQDYFAPGRPRDGQLSIASADKLKRFICLLAGYVVNIYGGELANIRSLVTEDIVTAFTSWSINERHKTGLAFKGELSSLHAALRQYGKIKDLDLSWFPALLKSIPLAPGTGALDRKISRMLPYSVISQSLRRLA